MNGKRITWHFVAACLNCIEHVTVLFSTCLAENIWDFMLHFRHIMSIVSSGIEIHLRMKECLFCSDTSHDCGKMGSKLMFDDKICSSI